MAAVRRQPAAAVLDVDDDPPRRGEACVREQTDQDGVRFRTALYVLINDQGVA